MRLLLVPVALAVLIVAGCGSSAKQSAGASTGRSECTSLGAGTGVRTGPKPSDTMLLTAVKTGHDACADRITFEFRPDPAATPGYRIEYRPAEEAQTEDGSGQHIPVAGSEYLVVRFEPAATADLSGDQLEFTYKGPRRVSSTGAHHVREVVKTGDFEAVLTWTIGLDERRPFKVNASQGRLELEIA